MLLVTGATGTTGSEVLRALKDREVPARALVRDETQAHNLRAHGFEPVTGDLGDPRTLRPALEGVERAPPFPNRTNVSFWTEASADRIRARIFERGVGETLSSGTGASGAAVAHVLRGGDSPVTVVLDGGELEVAVDEALHVQLTGWAVPVYRAELSDEFKREEGL